MKHLADKDGKIVLHRFERLEPKDPDYEVNPDDVVVCLGLDTETTGLNAYKDKIIELAAVVIAFHKKTGDILEVIAEYHGFEDPGFPLPAEASAVNGITDADVKGKKIDWKQVYQMVEGVEFCVAFNAGFDAQFLDVAFMERFGNVPKDLWVCGLRQVDWSAYPVEKQEILAIYHGMWSDAHRATTDVHMMLRLLEMEKALPKLAEQAPLDAYEVQVTGGPRDEVSLRKLKTKDRRFTFDNDHKMWWRQVNSRQEAEALVRYLDDYYDGKNLAAVRRIPARERYGLSEGAHRKSGEDMRKVWGI